MIRLRIIDPSLRSGNDTGTIVVRRINHTKSRSVAHYDLNKLISYMIVGSGSTSISVVAKQIRALVGVRFSPDDT